MLFVDGKSKIDKLALQAYVRERLGELEAAAEAVVAGGENQTKWLEARDWMVSNGSEKQKEAWLKAWKEIEQLPVLIKTWRGQTVESAERLEFFILSKAEEIKSSDQQHDYYWALQIRHDQLVALVEVLVALVSHLERMLLMKPKTLVEDPTFLGLAERGIEDQVYLEAEKIHQERSKLLQG